MRTRWAGAGLIVVVGLLTGGCKKSEGEGAKAAAARAAGSGGAPTTAAAGSGSAPTPAAATGSADAPAPRADPSADPYSHRPLYYARALTEADLAGRTLRELSLMRNWIYARVGNAFRKQWLATFFKQYDWYHPREHQELSKLTEYDKKNAQRIAVEEGAITEASLRQRRDAIVARLKDDPDYPDAPAHPEDVIELSLLSARLGEWVEPKPGAEAASPLEDPSMLDRLLTLNDVRDLSRRDLRILRNLIYARHGRAFKSALLTEYFESTDWYLPNPSYSDALLTKVDKKNVQLVLSLEHELGGPLTEQEQLLEETGGDWMGGA